MRLLLWSIAVGALVGTGRAVHAHDRPAAIVLIGVAAVFGVLAHLAGWKAAR